MKKINIAVIIIILIMSVHTGGIYFYFNKSQWDREYLKRHGQELRAAIVELRKYSPPKSADRYGRIFYQYVTPAGETLSSDSWVNHDQYARLAGMTEVPILYDPAKVNHSILKIKIE